MIILLTRNLPCFRRNTGHWLLSGVRSRLRETTFLGLLCLVGPTGLLGQISPLPDAEVPPINLPVSPPSTETDQPPGDTQAHILGWSIKDETGPSSRDGRPLMLDPGNRNVVVFFEGRPSGLGIQYRYRLLDYDTDWTDTRQPIAHYRRLPAGKYRFEVQARKSGEAWGRVKSTLLIEQRPFFYQTWYFDLLLVSFLVLLAWQLLYQRDLLHKGQIGIVLEERSRIARDCHDTLMAGFAAISWQLEATANLFRDGDATETPAAQSCELARSMVAHCQAEARRIIWDLRDSQEVTNLLSLALTRAITMHRVTDGIETRFDMEGDEVPIAPAAVHHLVCIGQEAVTNAIRHSGASVIQVRLRYDIDSLTLSIMDNGRGFQTSNLGLRAGHFGIPVMEERTRKLRGLLRLHSTEGRGTELEVSVNFTAVKQPRAALNQTITRLVPRKPLQES